MANEKTMHKAVCSDCGKDCEVSFEPSPDKPVYCDACFQRKREEKRTKSREKRMYQAVCVVCGKKCEVPVDPAKGKPVYCGDCFRKAGRKGGGDQTARQLQMINAKLDKLIAALISSAPANEAKKPAKAGEATIKKTVKKATAAKPKKAAKSKTTKTAAAKKKTVKKKK